MERRSVEYYIWMGTAIRFLTDLDDRQLVYGEGYVLNNIRSLLVALQRNNMHVTLRVARDLTEIGKRYADEEKNREAASDEGDDPGRRGDNRRVTAAEARDIRAAADSVRTTMLAEAAGHEAFIMRDKRYAADNLLDSVDRLMSEGVYASLPELARFDFAEAGRCVACELPTAAAFHLMRGTEGTLRAFYCRLVKRQRVSPLMWGPMTEHLKRRRDTPPDVLMNHLDNLRRSFRNPTQHPDKVYDIDEVQDLMALSFDVVTRMQRHLTDVGK